MKKAQIITIGDEILIGQIVDSNSAWIAQRLNRLGIEIHEILSISDEYQHIIQSLEYASKKNDLVIVTGGLGPTKDDKTKDALCSFFETKLVLHEPTLNHIESFFKLRGMSVNKLNRDQALIPSGCIPLHNDSGTAPGMWFEKGKTFYVFLPGVPCEMKSLMEKEVLPRLKHFSDEKVIHKTVITQGIAESVLAEQISDWENNLPDKVKLAYLPRPGIVRLRLTITGNDSISMENTLNDQIEKLKIIIPDHFFGNDEEQPEEIVGKLLIKKGYKTLATAESCTGGAIASLITSIPGSSRYFKGAIVAYDNNVKIQHLRVQKVLIEEHGAVSKEVVEAMAEGALKALDTDYSIATSGIAGPTGGTPEKPVGTVWIAVASKDEVISGKFQFGENRERNITKSVMSGLNMLRKVILSRE